MINSAAGVAAVVAPKAGVAAALEYFIVKLDYL